MSTYGRKFAAANPCEHLHKESSITTMQHSDQRKACGTCDLNALNCGGFRHASRRSRRCLPNLGLQAPSQQCSCGPLMLPAALEMARYGNKNGRCNIYTAVDVDLRNHGVQPDCEHFPDAMALVGIAWDSRGWICTLQKKKK